MFSFKLFATLLILFSTVVNAASIGGAIARRAVEPMTNAQRLARGLPVAAPAKFARNLPGHDQTRNPTPVNEAKGAAPSGTPTSSYSGRIEVRTKSGDVLGYVRNWQSGSVSGINEGGPDEELHVSFNTPQSKKGSFSIKATNPNFPAPFFIGIVGNSKIGKGSPNTLDFENVVQTRTGAAPITKNGKAQESSVWTIDRKTYELTAHYVNPTGSKPKTYIFYDIRENSLFFGGDIDAYNKQNADTPSSVVTFHLVKLAA